MHLIKLVLFKKKICVNNVVVTLLIISIINLVSIEN